MTVITLNPGPSFSQKAKQSANTLFNTNKTGDDVKERTNEQRMTGNLQEIAGQARDKYLAAIEVYKKRSNPKDNPYSNKSVTLADGTRGYVNNLGYFQKYNNEKDTTGIHGCPKKNENVNVPEAGNEAALLSESSLLGLAQPKIRYTSCGAEGKHLFVSSISAKTPRATPLKCVKFTPGTMKVATYPNVKKENVFTYEGCKRYASTNGYSYFGLQNYDEGDITSTCLVGNNYAEIMRGGQAKQITTNVEVWNSSSIIAPNSIRFRPFVVGSHVRRKNRGSERTKLLKNALEDSSMIVGNFRINGTGKGDVEIKIEQYNNDVSVTRTNASGWNQDLVLPVFSTDNNNDKRGLALLKTKQGQMDMQAAYARYLKEGQTGDIVIEKGTGGKASSKHLNSFKIMNTGQLVAFSEPSGKGRTILRIPNKRPRNTCNQSVGPITLLGATYGLNCPNTKATDNNALTRLSEMFGKDGNPATWNFKVTNRLVPGTDPAPGCQKDLIVNYQCGDTATKTKTFRQSTYATIDCNITRAQNGKPCQSSIIIYGGDDNPQGKAGVEIVMRDPSTGTIYPTWSWLLNSSQTKELITDTGPVDTDYINNARFVQQRGDHLIPLNKGEYGVSRNGKVTLKINENGQLSISIRTNKMACITGADGNKTTIDKSGAFIYSLPYETPAPNAVGKLGYVDRNGILHEYKKQAYKPGNGYKTLNNAKVTDSNLPRMPLSNQTLRGCRDACSARNDCYGAVYEKNTNLCYLKNKTIVNKEIWDEKNNVLFHRNVALDKTKIPKGCGAYPLYEADSVLWNYYPKGENMTPKTMCDLQSFLQEPDIVALRRDWMEKQERADNAAKILRKSANNTIDDRYLQNEETIMNNASTATNKIVYDINMGPKISAAVYTGGGQFPTNLEDDTTYVPVDSSSTAGIEKFTVLSGEENYDDIKENPQPGLFSPSQRARTNQFRNIDGIVDDSQLIVTEESYKFAVWCIVAVSLGILSFRVLRKITRF